MMQSFFQCCDVTSQIGDGTTSGNSVFYLLLELVDLLWISSVWVALD